MREASVVEATSISNCLSYRMVIINKRRDDKVKGFDYHILSTSGVVITLEKYFNIQKCTNLIEMDSFTLNFE